ncbi:MAG TPA: ABC transporter substrate-binding protein [Burkholderiaceae bacterium]|jgi:NitT/TauT family transport system substrate-binding protein|nr:ABC transporter substrate-binding protein [Burkholderiaceae bacterium]
MKLCSVSIALALGAGLAPAAVHADEKITIMVSGMEKQIYLPAKLTEQLGYFKDQGLDVELQSEPSGVNGENEMLAGAVQGVVGFYDHTIDLQAKGKAAMSVVQFSQAPGEVVLVSSKLADTIKSPADFKGRTLGVTGLGSSTNFLMQYLAVSNGVKVSEITPLPVGAGSTFIAAMKQGRIDAGMTTEPTVSTMLASGEAKVLIDLRTPELTAKALGGLYPAACLYMPTVWINAHHEQVQKLANAFVKTMKFIQAHSAEEIASKMPPDYYGSAKASYVSALDGSKAMFTPDGRMPASGPPTVLKVLQGFDKQVAGRTIDLSKTFTTDFVSAAK